MKTFLAVIGVLFLLFLVWSFGLARGVKLGSLINLNGGNGGTDCDPSRQGYRKDGVKDSNCGSVGCDPNRTGYDMDGFPDPNCGFGRSTTVTEKVTVTTRPEIIEFTSRFTKTAAFSTDVVKLQRKIGVPATGFYDDQTRLAFAKKLQDYITAHPNFSTMEYCMKNRNLGVAVDCLLGYGII